MYLMVLQRVEQVKVKAENRASTLIDVEGRPDHTGSLEGGSPSCCWSGLEGAEGCSEGQWVLTMEMSTKCNG